MYLKYSSVHDTSITILCKNGLLLSWEKLQCQREEVNEQKHYAVVIVKRTTGCTENQDSWLWANWQHVHFFSKLHSNIKCTITGARKSRIARLLFLLLYKEEKVIWLCERCYSFNSPQGRLEIPCTLHFSW